MLPRRRKAINSKDVVSAGYESELEEGSDGEDYQRFMNDIANMMWRDRYGASMHGAATKEMLGRLEDSRQQTITRKKLANRSLRAKGMKPIWRDY